MIIVIDAYNVLKQTAHSGHVSQRERANFITQLVGYATQKGNKIIVVFDAGPHERPHKERTGNVYVIYSGVQETADDYIKRYLEEHSSKDILLVSTDRELNRWADRHAVPSLDSSHFYTLFKKSMQQKNEDVVHETQLIKMGSSDQDVDNIMHEMSEVVHSKVEDVVYDIDMQGTKKLSKKERALMRKIKKL